MERTYRLIVWGRFERLTASQRAELLADQESHGMFSARFTPGGTFLYGPELVGFQFRYEIRAIEPTAQDAEMLARMQAEDAAIADLEARGLQGRIVDISATCVEDMRFRQGASR